ncbi:MAG: hypothetical protein H6R19_2394 [Proteobacteria bacterium]|nr:hypothetical protein [Pseudomonadota bacterium]
MPWVITQNHRLHRYAGQTVAILATLITQDSNCWQAFNDMAAICFQQGDTAGALSLLARAVEKEGTPGLARLNLAAVQRVAGNIEAALINYAMLVNAEPDNDLYRNTLAEILASNQTLSQDIYRELLRALCPSRHASGRS